MSFIKSSPAVRAALGARLQTAGFTSSARAMGGGATRHNNDPEVCCNLAPEGTVYTDKTVGARERKAGCPEEALQGF